MVVTVLINPAAGGAAALKADIRELFLAAGLEAQVIELRPGRDPAEDAREASSVSSIVVAAGGDGTVSRVAAGLIGTSAVLAVLPIGTLNHFAKDLGIPLDVEKAVAATVTGQVVSVDVGCVNDRTFINNSSIGVYPDIVKAREELRRQGHRKWAAMAMAILRVLRRDRGMSVRLDVGGRQSVRRTPFVFVGNNEYSIEGIHFGGRTTLEAGRLFAYLSPRLRTRELPTLLRLALRGRVRESGTLEIVSAHELWIDTPHRHHVRVACDGEIKTMRTPLHYQIRPGALKVLRPTA